jgi:hypothetical protein
MSDLSLGFEEWWKAIPPNPRKKGKQEAKKIWVEKKLSFSRDAIIEKMKHDAKNPNWLAGYAPLPKTYLNGGLHFEDWQDTEPEPAVIDFYDIDNVQCRTCNDRVWLTRITGEEEEREHYRGVLVSWPCPDCAAGQAILNGSKIRAVKQAAKKKKDFKRAGEGALF